MSSSPSSPSWSVSVFRVQVERPFKFIRQPIAIGVGNSRSVSSKSRRPFPLRSSRVSSNPSLSSSRSQASPVRPHRSSCQGLEPERNYLPHQDGHPIVIQVALIALAVIIQVSKAAAGMKGHGSTKSGSPSLSSLRRTDLRVRLGRCRVDCPMPLRGNCRLHS